MRPGRSPAGSKIGISRAPGYGNDTGSGLMTSSGTWVLVLLAADAAVWTMSWAAWEAAVMAAVGSDGGRIHRPVAAKTKTP